MSEPLRPWREQAAPRERAAEVVKQAAEVQPRAMDLAPGWDAVLEQATQPRRQPWLVPAGALAVAVGVAIGLLMMKPQPALVAASPSTLWEAQRDGGVQLLAGRLQTSRPVSLTLESPQVSITVRACRFAAEVLSEGTQLSVFEGEAVVRSGLGEVRVLHAGESGLWLALPAIPPALETPAVASTQTCAEVVPTKRAECLQAAATREGLEAEIALFELGRLQAGNGDAEAAVRTWQASLTRFPQGVFGPEARLALLVTLTQQRRFLEALEVAHQFELRDSEDPRRDDVQVLRRQLEWRARQR